MSRKIDFRAWFNDKMYWQEYCGGFSYFIEPTSCDQEEQDAFSLEEIFVWSKDGKCILQQNTGLTDSTGKEIYEGDILEELIQNESATQLGVCKQVLGGWRIFSLPDSKNCWHGWKQKVVGNIFETPELLV